jgi:hypothetical protein
VKEAAIDKTKKEVKNKSNEAPKPEFPKCMNKK